MLWQPMRSISSFETVSEDFALDNLELPKTDQEKLVEMPWTMRPFKVGSPL